MKCANPYQTGANSYNYGRRFIRIRALAFIFSHNYYTTFDCHWTPLTLHTTLQIHCIMGVQEQSKSFLSNDITPRVSLLTLSPSSLHRGSSGGHIQLRHFLITGFTNKNRSILRTPSRTPQIPLAYPLGYAYPSLGTPGVGRGEESMVQGVVKSLWCRAW